MDKSLIEGKLSKRYAMGHSQETINKNMRLLMDERDIPQRDALNIAKGMAMYEWFLYRNNYDFPEHLK